MITGDNADGSIGLRCIVDRKGTAIIQEPSTAESPTMPRAALAAVPQATVLPLREIAPHLVRLAADRAKPRGPAGVRK